MEIPKLKRSLVGKDDKPAPRISINPSVFVSLGPKPISLLELTTETCRWPIDHKGAILFCGSSTIDVYCCAHSELSRGKGTQSERNALRDAVRRDMSVPSVGE